MKDLNTCMNCSRWKHPTQASACYPARNFDDVELMVEFKHHPNGAAYCDEHKPYYNKRVKNEIKTESAN